MKKFILIGAVVTLSLVGCGPTETESVHCDTTVCVKADSIKADSVKTVTHGKDTSLAKKGR